MILHTRLPALFGAQAIALYLLVLVVPERQGDHALLAHERVHQCEQLLSQALWAVAMLLLPVPWWLALVPVWGLAYMVPAFRLRAEVRAYRVQIANGASLEGCARNLALMYGLRLDLAKARELLA